MQVDELTANATIWQKKEKSAKCRKSYLDISLPPFRRSET